MGADVVITDQGITLTITSIVIGIVINQLYPAPVLAIIKENISKNSELINPNGVAQVKELDWGNTEDVITEFKPPYDFVIGLLFIPLIYLLSMGFILIVILAIFRIRCCIPDGGYTTPH